MDNRTLILPEDIQSRLMVELVSTRTRPTARAFALGFHLGMMIAAKLIENRRLYQTRKPKLIEVIQNTYPLSFDDISLLMTDLLETKFEWRVDETEANAILKDIPYKKIFADGVTLAYYQLVIAPSTFFDAVCSQTSGEAVFLMRERLYRAQEDFKKINAQYRII